MTKLAGLLASALASMIFVEVAQASDFDGAWANNSEACNRLYIKKTGRTSFVRNADMYGSGFIIDGNQIRGKMARCKVTMVKRDGDVAHLVAACSTDIAVETVQFTVKIVDRDRMIRTFPGIPELDATYVRCPAL
jgi:hypothetical protein